MPRHSRKRDHPERAKKKAPPSGKTHAAMGTSRGRRTALNVRSRSHQRMVQQVLLGPKLDRNRILDYVFDDTFLDSPSKMSFARLVLWLAWSDDVPPVDMLWMRDSPHKARIASWKRGGAYADALPFARRVQRLAQGTRSPKVASSSRQGRSDSACAGRSRSRCKPPRCTYASGPVRSYCRRA